MKHAQFILFDGFDPLDVIAPFEVLAAAADEVASDMVIELVCAGEPRSFLSGVRGISLAASATLDPAKPGYVIVPGAAGPVDGDPDVVETIPVLLGRLAVSDVMPLVERALRNPEVTVAAVCGASLALGMAGLLEGRAAVTHVLGNEVLEAAGVDVVRARVVDDGDLVTAGGVTSGLDLGLHLAAREFGARSAFAVEQLFEYERRGTPWTSDRSRTHRVTQ